MDWIVRISLIPYMTLRFGRLVEHSYSLSQRYLKNGGIVRTDNMEKRSHCFEIHVFLQPHPWKVLRDLRLESHEKAFHLSLRNIKYDR